MFFFAQLTQPVILCLSVSFSFLYLTIASSQAATFVNSSSSLEANSFSHKLQESSVFSSAFALISTTEQTFFGASDPQFVTGPTFIPHPDAINLPVVEQLLPNGVSTFLPLDLDFINGEVTGTSQIILSENRQLLSANLTSQLQYKLAENPVAVSSIVGQSGWQMSFFIPQEEVFFFEFTSLINSQFTSQVPYSRETIVIYFYTLPIGASLVNQIISFSLNTKPMISSNHPEINVGLLAITPGSESLEILGNSSPYFAIDEISSQQVKGALKYFPEQPTNLTIIAYTSSSLTSSNDHIVVSEPSPSLGIVFACLILIIRKRINNK